MLQKTEVKSISLSGILNPILSCQTLQEPWVLPMDTQGVQDPYLSPTCPNVFAIKRKGNNPDFADQSTVN